MSADPLAESPLV